MTEIINMQREARADAIEGLRHLADLFEANPDLTVPRFMNWHNGYGWETGPGEVDRFNELHDLADALGGVTVMEDPDTRDRTLQIDFGALKFHARARADLREKEAEPAPQPRPVDRPLPQDEE